MDKKNSKIAVFHDAFLYRGGGERLVTLMAKSLDADLISGFFSEWSFVPEELGFNGQKIALGNPIFKKWFRHLALKNRFKSAKTKEILKNYETIIFSGNCLDTLENLPKNIKTVYYCHTPPRYLFDFREMYLAKFPKIIRPIIEKFFDLQAEKYKKQLDKIDIIFTNSQNVHDRLLNFCNKESTILYPPTDITKFKPKNELSENNFVKNLGKNIFEQTWKSEYYLSFSRLSAPKRVDLVVDAFLEMPDKNLVFTYGQNDPEKDKIFAKIQNAKNIFAIPAPSDENFISLVAHSIANIYIPIDEDFGMSPVEAMACGIPTIGVNEWGLKETIIDGKTGFLLPKDISKNDIISAVKNLNFEKSEKMNLDCRNRANDFSLENFIKNLKKYL